MQTFTDWKGSKGERMDEFWENFKLFYDNPKMRGEPETQLKLVEDLGFKVKSVEDVVQMGGRKMVKDA